MARRRYISTEISVDSRIAKLAEKHGDFAALLYTWMIPHATDDCCITAEPDELLMLVVPGLRSKNCNDVMQAVDGMVELGLLFREGDNLVFPPEAFYRYQTYISANNRRTPQNAEERRETPQNAASPSLSLSPSPSPSLSPSPKEEIAPARAFSPVEVEDRSFAGQYVWHHEQSKGMHPGGSAVAAAEQLERDFGREACVTYANDLNWEKHPNYMRPGLLQRAKEKANGNGSGEGGGKSAAPEGAGGVADRVSGLDRRRAAIAARG